LQIRIGRLRLAYPELSKIGELFRSGNSGIHGDTARRQSPMQASTDRSEIAGAEKREELILETRSKRGSENFETGEVLVSAEKHGAIIMEIGGRKRYFTKPIRLNGVYCDSPFQIGAGMS